MLKTRVTEMLGIRYSVMSAPMGLHSGGHLVAAVFAAGGLGTFRGTNPAGPDWVREHELRLSLDQVVPPYLEALGHRDPDICRSTSASRPRVWMPSGLLPKSFITSATRQSASSGSVLHIWFNSSSPIGLQA